jgi:RNA recognition motif-containing protein
MSRFQTGGKRQRESIRDRKKTDKADRLRRNRMARARGEIPPDELAAPEPMSEVRLEDVVIGVASQPRRNVGAAVRLFVGGLDSGTTAEGLRQAFGQFGTVEDATVILDRATGRSRGFGFVTFATSAEATAAMTAMNGRELDGRILKVNNAESR